MQDNKETLKESQVQIHVEVVEVPEPPGPSAEAFINFEEITEEAQKLDQAKVREEKPKYQRVRQNTKLTEEYTKPLESFDERREQISMPTASVGELDHVIEAIPQINLGASEEGRKWVNVLNGGLQNLRIDDSGLEALENPDAEFGQSVAHDSGALKPTLQRVAVQGGAVVSGEKAILGLRSKTGLGVMVRKPFWHSGIWLTVKSPQEPDLIELQRAITASKVELGRHTWGLALSAVSGIVHESYFNLFLDNFYSSSAKEKDDLLDLILLPDLSTMVWQLACAVYPNGFQYSRACTCNPEKCNHVSQELINPVKLLFVNHRALTPEQKNHMSNKTSGSMDSDSIRKYQQQMLKGQKRELKYKLKNGVEIKITLKIPTLREYFNATHNWVDRLNDRVIEALGVDSSTRERNNYINKLSVSTVMRQYSHFIDSIDYGDIIKDTETIDVALDSLSTEPDITEKFTTDIKKYINDTMVSVIGIPDYNCPVCKGAQSAAFSNETPLGTNVLPIDPLMTFFTLHSQKLNRLG